MNNVRLFLWVTLAMMAWLTYSAWVIDHAPPPVQQPAVVAAPGAPTGGGLSNELPDIGGTLPTPVTDTPAAPVQDLVRVRTDVLDLSIDLRGGDLVRADLLAYPVDKHSPDQLVRLLDYLPEDRWVFQTGLATAARDDAEPNHQATFAAAQREYVLANGQDELRVVLDWVGGGGITARKLYTFRRGQYGVDLTLEVTNSAATAWSGAPYVQMSRLHNPPERSYWSVDSYSFTGPILYNGDDYDTYDFDDLLEQPVEQTVKGGWFAAVQHHFLAAAVPPPEDEAKYTAAAGDRTFQLRALGPVASVAPGATFQYPYHLFVGPKLQEQLAATGPELELTVDYGVFTVLAAPLFWLLSKIELFVGNWGWAIIICTFLIKLAFYRLTAASGRSMAKMRELAPRMKQLQERFKDDRQALSQHMMDLYKREKVNPAAGCLPILIQMPFFLAFYWVLVESVEMRQAPFALWIDDLSVRDPFFVLPLLMGAAMFFQTKLSPAPPDPMQARIMQIMPIVFTGFFMLFPAGLVLYWLTNTVLSIAQQWRINKIVAAEKTRAG